MNFTQLDIPSSRLLLDPNNYRFHDLATYRPVPNRTRYPEAGVQDRALGLLQTTDSFDLESLKDSIKTNTYVPLERVVVELFDGEGETARYLVVEGNRRVAAVKTLLAEQAAGSADIPAATLASIAAIPSIQITGTEEERRAYKQKLMAIRHIAGIKEWGPYAGIFSKLPFVPRRKRNDWRSGCVSESPKSSMRWKTPARFRSSSSTTPMRDG